MHRVFTGMCRDNVGFKVWGYSLGILLELLKSSRVNGRVSKEVFSQQKERRHRNFIAIRFTDLMKTPVAYQGA